MTTDLAPDGRCAQLCADGLDDHPTATYHR